MVELNFSKIKLEDMIEFSEVATVIQLAVAPAFLLTGIGAILAVMATRLSRIVDRYRILNEGPKKLNMEHKKEIEYLIKRSKWTHWAIALTTVSALFVCAWQPNGQNIQ